ncbi:MAG: methyltransferase domain-containing protein [Geodermatophilaceae bacterium]
MSTAADRWRAELEAWTIPDEILAAAPESPYGFPAGMFTAEADPADTPSHRRAREVLPMGGTVLDVGCGGGGAAMALVPTAGLVTGVDSAPHMVEAFAAAADARGVAHREVLGSWPDVAVEAGKADIVVAHHVTYNVADLVPFALALDNAARRRVVVEMTDVHPWVPTNDLWLRFHNLARPAGPSARLCAEVLTAAGLDVRSQRWQRPARRTDRAGTVSFIRRRLCLPVGAEPEVDAALPVDYQFQLRAVTTLWWEPTPRRS